MPGLRSSRFRRVSNQQDFRAILALQQELDAKRDELITQIKAVLESERAKGSHRIIVDLDGEIYELTKRDVIIELCRKHGGFYHDYRLVRLGKPLK
jgi:hypothetical protein